MIRRRGVRGCVAVLAVLLLARAGAAQSQAYPFSSGQWQGMGPKARVVQYLGRESLYLDNAGVYLDGLFMEDGRIEVDVASPAPQSYAHVLFRAPSAGEAEDVYLRLGASGSPAAVQYAPMFKGVSAWQLQGGATGWGRAVFDKNAWTHLRIDVAGQTAKVFVNDSAQPVLTVPRLRRGPGAGVLVLHGEFGVYYSNFHVTPAVPAAAAVPLAKAAPSEPGLLLDWELSDAIVADSIKGDAVPAVAGWSPARADADGLLNISRFRAKPAGSGAVLARTTIVSERDQVKKLLFGYSDATRVYLNGRPLFEGDSGFRSRDEQFMGMIGWKDAVYLDLRKGSNELLFIVAESFGGWGLQARLADVR